VLVNKTEDSVESIRFFFSYCRFYSRNYIKASTRKLFMWSQSRSHWLIFCAVFLMMCLRDCCQAPTDSLWLTESRLYVCVYISVLFDQCCFSITTHSHWLLMRDSISVAGRRSSREREKCVILYPGLLASNDPFQPMSLSCCYAVTSRFGGQSTFGPSNPFPYSGAMERSKSSHKWRIPRRVICIAISHGHKNKPPRD